MTVKVDAGNTISAASSIDMDSMALKENDWSYRSIGSTTNVGYQEYDALSLFKRLYTKIYNIIREAASYIYILEDNAIEIHNINFDLSTCEEDEVDPFTTVDFFINHKTLDEPLQIKVDLNLKMNDDFNTGYIARAIADKEDEA